MLLKNKGLRSLAFLMVMILLLSVIPTQSVQALNIIYRVTPTGATSGTCGDTWANPCALQYAISLAGTGDQIWAIAGTYYPTTGTDRTISFNLKSGLAIYGGFAGTETELTQRDPVANVTTLSGDIGTIGDNTDNSYHVVYGYRIGNTSIFDGFSISKGNANGVYPANWGGGLYLVSSNLSLANLNISSNSAIQYGGGIFNSSSSPTLTGIVISNNVAGEGGGGVFNHDSSPTFINTSFIGNSSQQRGGGLYNYTSNPILTNVVFSGNAAQTLGGGMDDYASNVSLTDVDFINNTAITGGGGIYSGNSNLSLIEVTFSGNSSKDGGGLLNATQNNVTLQEVAFESNSASERGGGMYNYDSEPILSNVTFSGNTAQQHGGGMFNSISNAQLDNVLFINNETDNWGGGMNNNDSSPILTNVTFSNNTAQNGGGLFNWEYSSPVMTNVTFIGNQSSARGGGMYSLDYCDFSITDSTFTGNSALEYGGGMFLSNSNPTLTNIKFEGNTTQQYGGGMYNSYTHATLTNVSFLGNLAGVYGGGMGSNNSDPILNSVTFSNNNANQSGGGMYNYESDPSLTNVTFTGNTASLDYGGGIFNSYSDLLLNSGTFTNNSAGKYGGGIAIWNWTGAISNTIFWENVAGIDGSQVFSFTADQPVINDSVIQYGCPSGALCTNIYTTDPLLGTLGDNGGFTQTIPIGMGSSALDTANAVTSPATDQRGVARPKGYADDIGAFELEWDPTVVELLSFTAERDGSSITLYWQTATEFDNLGFNLYRATAADGEKTLLNETLIPTNTYPGSLLGAAYSFTDPKTLDRRITYYYLLEDVNIHGYKTLHGPVEIAGDPGIFELVSFTANPIDKNVVLTWVTTNEPDINGYELYRANDVDGKKTLLTTEAIPSLGLDGGIYTFTDAGRDLRQGLKPSHTYYYWLETIQISNQPASYGPVEVKTLPKVPPQKHKLPHQSK